MQYLSNSPNIQTFHLFVWPWQIWTPSFVCKQMLCRTQRIWLVKYFRITLIIKIKYVMDFNFISNYPISPWILTSGTVCSNKVKIESWKASVDPIPQLESSWKHFKLWSPTPASLLLFASCCDTISGTDYFDYQTIGHCRTTRGPTSLLDCMHQPQGSCYTNKQKSLSPRTLSVCFYQLQNINLFSSGKVLIESELDIPI